MNNLANRLVNQLDSLIPFLALSHEEVFSVIRERYKDWLPEGQQESLPGTFAVYQTQVAHSAFLLGYSYYEAFLTDLVRQIYSCRPEMLPKEKVLKFSEILGHLGQESLLSYMIDKEITALFYNSMEETVKYFQRKLKLQWPEPAARTAVEASLLRNCIIHNNARVDIRLAQSSGWQSGAAIKLEITQVHEFGLAARSVARTLYGQAETNFPPNCKPEPNPA